MNNETYFQKDIHCEAKRIRHSQTHHGAKNLMKIFLPAVAESKLSDVKLSTLALATDAKRAIDNRVNFMVNGSTRDCSTSGANAWCAEMCMVMR